MNINATGIANKSSSGEILDVFFPIINFNGKTTEIHSLGEFDLSKEIIEISWDESDLNSPVKDVCSAYLKLHLLSYKFVLPNSINLDGLLAHFLMLLGQIMDLYQLTRSIKNCLSLNKIIQTFTLDRLISSPV